MNMNVEIDQRKQKAITEHNGYRERLRQEKLAKDAANLSADAEIEAAILARRKDEEERAKITAALQKLYAKREVDIAAMLAAEEERKKAGIPEERQDPPARRIAKMLRKRLGGDFDAVLADIRTVNFESLQIELARIPADERAAELALEREALAARLAEEARTLPEPQDDEEAAILVRHGFPIEKRQAELNAGAL